MQHDTLHLRMQRNCGGEKNLKKEIFIKLNAVLDMAAIGVWFSVKLNNISKNRVNLSNMEFKENCYLLITPLDMNEIIMITKNCQGASVFPMDKGFWKCFSCNPAPNGGFRCGMIICDTNREICQNRL